jgi:hypothetical protein
MEAPEPQSLLDRLTEKFNNSRFFTISFVLHVLLISIFSGTVLFEAMQEPPDFEGGEGLSPPENKSRHHRQWLLRNRRRQPSPSPHPR